MVGQPYQLLLTSREPGLPVLTTPQRVEKRSIPSLLISAKPLTWFHPIDQTKIKKYIQTSVALDPNLLGK